MRRQRLAMICLGGLALGLAAVGRAAIYRSIAADLHAYEFDGDGEPFTESSGRLEEIAAAGRAIATLHREKGKPVAGDWLHKHPEGGQTYESYRQGTPNRPTSTRTTLYLQPWGDFDPRQLELLALTGEMLGLFYGVPVRILGGHGLEGVPEDGRAYDPDLGGLRLKTSYVMSELHQFRPDDAVALLAVTTVDLTPRGNGSWVFGQASVDGRVGVCSLYRHGDPDEDFALSLKRTLKTAVHETGHMLGILHCAAFACAMNGSSSRREADGQPAWFCPQDEMKVWLACRVDPAGRYERLAAFAESHGLESEARFWRRSREAVIRADGRGAIR